MSKFLLALAVAFSVALSAPHARADDQSDVAKARAAYEAKNYEDAERRLRAMLEPDPGTLKDPTLRSQARMYLGATLWSLKKSREALALFEKLLLDDPSFEADPLSFPGDVIDVFIDTRKRIIDKINATKAEHARQAAERKAREEEEKRRAAERLRLLEKLATEEKITERHSRWIAAIPFGVGQFQNGQTALGWTFLGTETAFLVGAAVAFPFFIYNKEQAYDLSAPDKARAIYLHRANAAVLTNRLLNGAFAVTAVIGILHAQLTFVPEAAETKKRPIPTVSGLTPIVAPQRGGGVLGIEGRF